MAADALTAYRTDTAAGKDSLLICDTTEMADALNQHIHHDTIDTGAPAVAAARGHRIAVGDLIISRQNDTTIPLRNTDDPAAEQNPVRNGNRWRVTAINPDNNRLLARRLDDNTLAAFFGDYLREHITHGYAVTVHSAQGVTADTTHAVLSEAATRALFYVAISRGRDADTAYLYERPVEREYDHQQSDGLQSAERGTSRDASRLARAIIANDSVRPVTAHAVAAQADGVALSDRVQGLLSRRGGAVRRRRAIHTEWQAESRAFVDAVVQARARHANRTREHGLDHGIEM
jgi:hypothetical protein